MVLAAVALGAGFGICHLLGLREHVAVVLGTTWDEAAGATTTGGVVYMVLYFAVVFAVPPLLLAGVLMAIAERLLARPAGRRQRDREADRRSKERPV
jgi:hypothetical protein